MRLASCRRGILDCGARVDDQPGLDGVVIVGASNLAEVDGSAIAAVRLRAPWWTFRTLGKNLTDTVVTRKKHTLVTHGPYFWIRHPLYSSAALIILAVSLIGANWFFFAVGVAVLAILVMRTRTEEMNLVARFGDSYQRYTDRTGRFLPRIGPSAPIVCLMFQAVIFDLYETLVTQSKTVVPRGGRLGEFLGLDQAAYRREWKQLRPHILRGQLTFQEALIEIGERLGVAIPAERVQCASEERARANTQVFQKIDSEVVALIGALRDLGIRLATISNCMAEDVAAWPGSVLASHFSCAVFSFEAGVVKPDPRIYLNAVEQLGGTRARRTLCWRWRR